MHGKTKPDQIRPGTDAAMRAAVHSPDRRRALQWALAAGCGALNPAAFAGQPGAGSPARKLQTWGYYPLWMKDSWKKLDFSLWDRLLWFETPVDAQGRLDLSSSLGREWQALAGAAGAAQVGTDLAVTLLDPERFRRIFSDQSRINNLLQQLGAAARVKGVKGIHLDFEVYAAIDDGMVDGFRHFMAMLHQSLHQLRHRPTLSVFYAAGGERDIFDAGTLAFADYVVVQGYDAHWAESRTAGPVAPLKGAHPMAWQKSLQHVLALDVPRSRILFSIPYFGYEWPVESAEPGARTTGRGQTTTYAPVDERLLPLIRIAVADRIARHPVGRDPESGSPYYVYLGPDGKWVQGWFEDEISLSEKFDFVIREQLCGVAAFPLGYDGGRFNGAIARKFGNRELRSR